jgi:hypothetical protein
VATRTRTRAAPEAAPGAPEPTAAPPEPVAVAPALDPAGRNRLERAVESMLRSRIFGD